MKDEDAVTSWSQDYTSTDSHNGNLSQSLKVDLGNYVVASSKKAFPSIHNLTYLD